MTLIDELKALAERWRGWESYKKDYSVEKLLCLERCADELTELLGKVAVTDEEIDDARRAYYDLTGEETSGAGMRDAIESVLGVTK